MQRRVSALTGAASGKLAVVPNGTDRARFSRPCPEEEREAFRASLGIRPGDRVIGTVARFSPEKSLSTLIGGMRRILQQYPQAFLLVVGDGFERQKLECLAGTEGVASRTLFTGIRGDIPQLLAAMDVFVLCSTGEAFGIVLLEAMAAGKPVVASGACAIPEIVRDGQEALLFPPGDTGRMAEGVMRFFSDEALAGRLAMAARERVKEFSDEAMVRGFEKVYQEVLGLGQCSLPS